MPKLLDFLKQLVSGSEQHKRNGVAPDCVALIFAPSEQGENSAQRQHALVCNQYPITPDEAHDYTQRFPAPPWRFAGHVFSYLIPSVGTAFEPHPDPDFPRGEWEQLLDSPVLGTGLVYREKIMSRLMNVDHETYKSVRDQGGSL